MGQIHVDDMTLERLSTDLGDFRPKSVGAKMCFAKSASWLCTVLYVQYIHYDKTRASNGLKANKTHGWHRKKKTFVIYQINTGFYCVWPEPNQSFRKASVKPALANHLNHIFMLNLLKDSRHTSSQRVPSCKIVHLLFLPRFYKCLLNPSSQTFSFQGASEV